MRAPAPLRDLVHTVATGRDVPAPPLPGWLVRRLAPLRPVAEVVATVAGLLMAIATVPAMSAYDEVDTFSTLVVAALTGLPLVLLPRSSIWAWRVCWLTALLSGTNQLYDTDTPWPANPVAIVVLLPVLLVVGYRQMAGVLVWVWLFSCALIWGYITESTAIGGTLLVSVVLLLGYLARRSAMVRGRLAEEQERGALLTERARIARELHDVVAHHMSLIAVRAETAQYRLGELPEPARGEFAEISRASREALTEMRRLLGVLRNEAEPAPVEPQPGLADLPALVDTARAAGTPVTVEVEGELTDLPPATDLSAYRIVQESLSNAARHAAGAPVELTLQRTGNSLVVRVANSAGKPTSTSDDGPGHGLRGMRERVSMLGGQLSAYPTAGGGFEVRADLPLGDAE